MKIDRIKIYNKFQGYCAYCGAKITLKEMQVDHVIPKFAFSHTRQCLIVDGQMFTEYLLNSPENLYPSCRSCNKWKNTFTVEQFRHEIEMQLTRLRKYNASFRLAERYNLVKENKDQVTFYFEILQI